MHQQCDSALQKLYAHSENAGQLIQVEDDVAPSVVEYVFPSQVIHHPLSAASLYEPG
jgi:hypothetical protein